MEPPILEGAQQVLTAHAEKARRILRAQVALVYLADMEKSETCTLATMSHPPDRSFSGSSTIQIRNGLKQVWEDGRPRVSPGMELPFAPRIETDSWSVFRIGSDVIPFGLLFALLPGDDPCSGERLKRVSSALNRSFAELHRAWVEWLIMRRSATLRSLLEISTSLSSSLDKETVLGKVVQNTAVLLYAKLCSLMLVDPEMRELVLEAAYGCSVEYLEKPNLPVSDSLLGRVVLGREVIRVRDVRVDPQYRHRDLARREGLCSLLAAPVQFAERVLGVLSIYSATPREWTDQDEDILRALASSAAVAIQNASFIDRITQIEEKARQASRLAVLGELTASLAHQIRNPLAVVNMLTHAWETSKLPKQIRDDLRVISSNIEGLNRIVEGALALARQRPPDPEPCDLSEIVDGLLLLLRRRLHDRRIQFINETAYSRTPLVADRDQLEQALLNLIINAIEAVPEEGEVGIRARETGDATEIEIWDSGEGIRPEFRERLFEPFATTKPGGLGLGLAVVNRIVRDHGGRIMVNDRPEGGTVFVLRFLNNPAQ